MAQAQGALLAREIIQRAAAVEQALCDLTEAQIWERPAPATNAVGNLVLHLCGNLMKYIARGVGGHPYERDRPYEFTASGLPRSDLLSRLRATVQTVREVLEGVADADLDSPYDGPEFAGLPKRAVAIHSVEHFGYHTGQIVLAVKILRSRR